MFYNNDLLERMIVGYGFRTERGAEGYTVSLDLPGVKREDLQVTTSGGILTVEAKRGESEKVYRGKLPEDISLDGIAALLRDGVLTILIPFREGWEKRVIEVG